MPIASVERRIAAPIATVFAAVDSRRSRMRFLPDNFTGARLISDEAAGPGARFVFTVRTGRGAYESTTTVIAHEPPRFIIERTDDGETSYETRWRFAEAEEETQVRMETHYPRPRGLVQWLLGPIARRALAQSMMVELIRLEQAVTGEEDGTATEQADAPEP